jgi:lambda family phage portal protein
MGVLDKLFDRFGYELPRKRSARPHRRQYHAAGHSRLRTWADQLLSPDAELWMDLATLRGRSRNLVRDNPHAASATRVWVENVVGVGLQYHPLVKLSDEALDTTANATLRQWWADWGTRSVCTLDRRHAWHDVERLAARTEFVDGEFLAIEHTGRGVNEFGYALQLMDPDQLDETLTQSATKSRNEIRMGVEVNEWSEAVAYHFWPNHPSDLSFMRRERIVVPAARVLHYYEVLRPGQTRGVPRLSPVMARLKLIDGYSEAALAAAVAGACNAILFEQDEEASLGENDDDPTGEIPLELEPAMTRLLPKHVRAVFSQVQYPHGEHDNFVNAELRATAAGVGIAVHSLTGNVAEANFSSLRAAEIQQRDVYRTEHRRFGTHLHSRVLRGALRNSVFNGAVDLPGDDWRRYAAHRFAGRGWTWVDPLKDLKAAELELALRLTTRSKLAMEGGRSFEEILQEWNQDTDLAAEWGVDLPDPKPSGAKPEPKETEDDDGSRKAN